MTTDQTQDRIFRSYEQLERELMPKRAKERRTGRVYDDLRETWLEITRRSVADTAASQHH